MERRLTVQERIAARSAAPPGPHERLASPRSSAPQPEPPLWAVSGASLPSLPPPHPAPPSSGLAGWAGWALIAFALLVGVGLVVRLAVDDATPVRATAPAEPVAVVPESVDAVEAPLSPVAPEAPVPEVAPPPPIQPPLDQVLPGDDADVGTDLLDFAWELAYEACGAIGLTPYLTLEETVAAFMLGWNAGEVELDGAGLTRADLDEAAGEGCRAGLVDA